MAQKSLRTFLKGKAMSNFICPECGMSNIDCGENGYKTAHEIELEKKLEITVKALKKLSEETLLTENGGRFVNSSSSIAQQALKEIEE